MRDPHAARCGLPQVMVSEFMFQFSRLDSFLGRRSIADRAMQFDRVIVRTPTLDQDLGFQRVVKCRQFQLLVTKRPARRLDAIMFLGLPTATLSVFANLRGAHRPAGRRPWRRIPRLSSH